MGKKKILIVDDEMDIVRLLQTTLTDKGYEVIVAFDGTQAVHRAHHDKPDLIILDIVMPAGDGYTVCKKLKQSSHTWTIPIIVLTGKMGEAGRKKSLEVGADFYLIKPYNRAVLLSMVEEALFSSSKPEEK